MSSLGLGKCVSARVQEEGKEGRLLQEEGALYCSSSSSAVARLVVVHSLNSLRATEHSPAGFADRSRNPLTNNMLQQHALLSALCQMLCISNPTAYFYLSCQPCRDLWAPKRDSMSKTSCFDLLIRIQRYSLKVLQGVFFHWASPRKI